MTIFADTPTLGLLLGVPVALLLIAAGVAALVLASRADDYDAPWLFWTGLGTVVVTLGITVFAMWPFKHDYHFWVPTEGKVEAVSKRLVPAGDKGMQEKFVFRLEDGRLRGVLDTRAALVKVGDTVKLKCKKSYEWGVSYDSHGWDCRWAGGADA